MRDCVQYHAEFNRLHVHRRVQKGHLRVVSDHSAVVNGVNVSGAGLEMAVCMPHCMCLQIRYMFAHGRFEKSHVESPRWWLNEARVPNLRQSKVNHQGYTSSAGYLATAYNLHNSSQISSHLYLSDALDSFSKLCIVETIFCMHIDFIPPRMMTAPSVASARWDPSVSSGITQRTSACTTSPRQVKIYAAGTPNAARHIALFCIKVFMAFLDSDNATLHFCTETAHCVTVLKEKHTLLSAHPMALDIVLVPKTRHYLAKLGERWERAHENVQGKRWINLRSATCLCDTRIVCPCALSPSRQVQFVQWIHAWWWF